MNDREKQPSDEPSDVDQDILDVIREERSRGRKPLDLEEQRIQRERQDAIRKIYRFGTETDLRKLLQLWDFEEEEIEEKIAIFRELRKSRKRS